MKTRSRFNSRLLIVVAALLVGVVLLWMRTDDASWIVKGSKGHPLEGNASVDLSSTDSKSLPSSASDADVEHPDNRTRVRGAGYIWGTALKNVFAGAGLGPDGQASLNVSALEKAFKGIVSPVDLASTTASPQLRAEYLSASITAALDLDVAHQPNLAAILEAIYTADAAASDSNDEARARRRGELTEQARIKFLCALPPEVLDQFREIFRSPKFVFETRSVAADAIEYGSVGGDLLTKGNAVFSIGNDGTVSIRAESTTFRQNTAVRKRN